MSCNSNLHQNTDQMSCVSKPQCPVGHCVVRCHCPEILESPVRGSGDEGEKQNVGGSQMEADRELDRNMSQTEKEGL